MRHCAKEIRQNKLMDVGQITRIYAQTICFLMYVHFHRQMEYVVNLQEHGRNSLRSLVNDFDKSKIVVREALMQTQMLFDSLMQEYFG